jgi:hypothetical protein
MHAAPLETPADVAWVLASYAREALARMERADLPALASVRSALCRPLTPDEAREGTGMVRRFDSEWWVQHIRRARGLLCIDLSDE